MVSNMMQLGSSTKARILNQANHFGHVENFQMLIIIITQSKAGSMNKVIGSWTSTRRVRQLDAELLETELSRIIEEDFWAIFSLIDVIFLFCIGTALDKTSGNLGRKNQIGTKRVAHIPLRKDLWCNLWANAATSQVGHGPQQDIFGIIDCHWRHDSQQFL